MTLKKTSARILPLLLAGILPLSGAASAPASVRLDLKQSSLGQLEQRLADIDAEIEQLASFTVRGGTGSVGYRSKSHPQPDSTARIRIELGEEVAIDAVVLVPVLYRDAETGLGSGGFPVAFRILAGTAHTTHVMASFSAEDHLLPRIAPLAVPFQPVKASWVEIEATSLSSAPNVHDYTLQLSEIMVFSGMENVALPLQKPLSTASPSPSAPIKGPQQKRFLTDGFTPYLMNAAQGSSSQTVLVTIGSQNPTLTLDLNASQPVHQINLHTADVTLSVPMGTFGWRAVPRHIRITGANRPDFADETFLCEYQQQTIFDNGPILIRRFPEARCRYIRLVIVDPTPVIPLDDGRPRIAFSEIEVLSKGQNSALGAPITTGSGLARYSARNLARITDGLNYYGSILPIREWMEQLALRHYLEREHPLISAELNRRYARQKDKLRLMSWLAAFLAAGILITILVNRIIRMRNVSKLKVRFAADLHDELGANLHAIKMLGDLAEDSESRAELKGLLDRSRDFAKRSINAVRYCTNTLEGRGLCKNLPEDMRRSASRLLADMEYQLSFEGEAFLVNLNPRKRVDLFFFYKECLANIIRHSGATQADTQLTVTPKELTLTITDNGIGMPDGIPNSLNRRTRMLGAKLSVERPQEGGTQITLNLKLRKWKLLK